MLNDHGHGRSALGIALASALIAGCTTFFPTDLGDARADGVNACGGVAVLEHAGGVAAPGDRCGPCGGGFLVCNGTDALRCLGAADENACGGCAPLVAEPDAPCGFCGDGFYTCQSPNNVVCSYASFPNACGGCGALDGAPGFPCSEGELDDGTWTCLDSLEVACGDGDLNACGGTLPLQWDGGISAPGQPCGSGCVEGVLVCDGTDRLTCRGAEEPNDCGGCSTLPGDVEGACGPCGTGSWECSDGELACATDPPNVCGGCGELGGGTPGAPCDGGTVICNTPDTVICASLGADTNACGGVGELDGEPGQACGTCGSGTWTCANVGTVVCEGDRGDEAHNGCGGCADLEGAPGARCGVCGSGTWACNGEDAVTCDGDAGDDALNECFGCGSLWGVVGDKCADCYAYACLGAGERLQCTFDGDGEFCGPPPTCETQGCEVLNRECLVDDLGHPYCGGCIDGFLAEGDECVGAACADESAASSDTGVAACPELPDSEWSECTTVDPPCGSDGERTRSVRTAVCVDGACALRTETQREDCTADTDGVVVGTVRGESCLAGARSDSCTLTGQRPVRTIVCEDGETVNQDAFEPCDRDTEGDTCGTDSSGTCHDGVCEGATPEPIGIGGTCVDGRDCDDGNCSRGVCAPPGMITIFAGRFEMGTDVLVVPLPDGISDGSPAHTVSLSRDFFVSATEVTNGLWELVTDSTVELSAGLPVTDVTWAEAIEFANRLSDREDLGRCYAIDGGTSSLTFDYGCEGYRLLTEAEFEYVMRAGTTTEYFCGALGTCMREHAVYGEASDSGPSVVRGTRSPNPWGLYDIAGNVWEWVWDRYDPDYYDERVGENPTGPVRGDGRVIRGGGFGSTVNELKSSARSSNTATSGRTDIGFRLARNRPD